MLFDRIGGAKVAAAAHFSARSVARHRENLSGPRQVRSRRGGGIEIGAAAGQKTSAEALL